MKSVFGSGRITIAVAGQSASYDFRNPTHPVETIH